MRTPRFGPPKLLVFDVFGTVVNWRGSLTAEGERLGASVRPAVRWDDFADAWAEEYVASIERVRRGEIPWAPLDTLLVSAFDRLLERFAVRGLAPGARAELAGAWHRLAPWPDSVRGLARLKEGFFIAPLSNANVSLMTDLSKRYALPWDCILSAELVRRYKPDSEVYLSAPAFFQLEPREVMMVAAHWRDLEAPRRLGMQTAYIRRELEPDLPAGARFDRVATDLCELASLLGR